MADSQLLADLISGITQGNIVPYLGPGVLKGVVNADSGAAIPADSDSLILAMNDGKPMAPRLMYEFPRAAMNLENKKGRKFIEKFLTKTYLETQWTDSGFHQWLVSLQPNYIVDINRDTQIQALYESTPHTLIVGMARIAGTDFRFKIYHHDGNGYREITQDAVDTALPVLFKPTGTPLPEPNYVASDADYVDYITELMGGFAIPGFLKQYRKDKQYLFMGLRMNRDTERMVLSDIIYGAGSPAGWVMLPDANDKEKRFCEKKNLQIIDADWTALLTVDKSSLTSVA
ncbi:SIR2 family protein [Ketobacter sp.]|uniref:SIR2 family protein n=1 Tax=Ketobacter sp. TaxID=2083498 RepID=UPI000F0DB65A|nr:SIR2 family protein [Ketobacter sp.]RLU02031.1 MAG: SIR2 family protein [Ketobacter sp.]